MEQKQLDHFRLSLISSKDEIEKMSKTNTEAAGTVILDQSMMGRLSRMDALQGQQMAQETARRRKMQLQKIGSALRRCHRRHIALQSRPQMTPRDLPTPLTSKASRC